MKKIFEFCLVICFVCILSSCYSFKHEHIVDEQWSYNEEFHWKSITCTQDRCMIEFATYEHEDLDDDNICDVCGYTNNNVHNHTWTYHAEDEIGHFKTFTCGCPSEEGTTPHADINKDGLCDECSYEMGEAHPVKYLGCETGHSMITLCGCCEAPAVEDPHLDDDKDNICDICKYSMIDVDISWLYTETHHWYQYGDQANVFEYGFHVDNDEDFICDVCDYLIIKQETDVPKTVWVYEDGAVIFDYEFSVGDTYRFDDRNIYINETLVFTIEDSCDHHYYEYNIGSTIVSAGTYEEFIEAIIVKKITINYYVDVYWFNPYNEYPVKVPLNCDLASLGMKYLTPGKFDIYRCVGIYFDEKFENEVTDSFEVLDMEDKVLYVKWEVLTYTVTFIYRDDNSYVEVLEVPANDNIIRIPIPDESIIKQNYKYVYWTSVSAEKYNFNESYIVSSNIVFYLVWENE